MTWSNHGLRWSDQKLWFKSSCLILYQNNASALMLRFGLEKHFICRLHWLRGETRNSNLKTQTKGERWLTMDPKGMTKTLQRHVWSKVFVIPVTPASPVTMGQSMIYSGPLGCPTCKQPLQLVWIRGYSFYFLTYLSAIPVLKTFHLQQLSR